MEYRECFVPVCENDTANSPNKVFVRVPKDLKEKWFREAQVENLRKDLRIFCCEDHFDKEGLAEALANTLNQVHYTNFLKLKCVLKCVYCQNTLEIVKEDLKNYYKHKLMNDEPILKTNATLRNVTKHTGEVPDKSRKGEISELQKLLMQTEEPAHHGALKKVKHEGNSTLSRDSVSPFPVQIEVATPCAGKKVNKITNSKKRITSCSPKPTIKRLKFETHDSTCRVCLKQTGSFSLSDKDGGIPYRAKIMRWTSLVILEGDGLPSLICIDCAALLNAAHEFFELCEASDRELQSQECPETITVEFIKLEEDAHSMSPEGETMSYEYIKEEMEEEEYSKEEIHQYDSSDSSAESSHNKRDQQKDGSYEPDLTETDGCSEPEKKRKVRKKKKKIKRNLVPCTHCKKSFKFEKTLLRHVELCHGQQRRFICETCGASFNEKVTLFNHQLIHNDLKPHQCQVCGRAFKQPGNMIRHVKYHTAERNYRCNLCPKAFKTKRGLYEHVHNTMTHANDKIKRLSCNFCDMTFSAKSSLISHIKKKHIENMVFPQTS